MAKPKTENGRSTPMTLKLSEGQKQALKDFGKAFGYGTMIGVIMTAIHQYAETHGDKQSPLT